MSSEPKEIGGLTRRQAEDAADLYRKDGATSDWSEPGGTFTVRTFYDRDLSSEELQELIGKQIWINRDLLEKLLKAERSEGRRRNVWLVIAIILSSVLFGAIAELLLHFNWSDQRGGYQIVPTAVGFLAFLVIQAFREWYYAYSRAESIRQAQAKLESAEAEAYRAGRSL